jgi:multiple sugar transport system ATP-binding protein
MASVTYDSVTKKFGEVTAVNNLNLDVKDKEFLVLVGPSGCGKTTALRLLAGLEEITTGNISIGERVVNDVAPKDRDIAMVFQSYALYPHMSVYDNMAFGLRLRKTPKEQINRRVKEAADILGIGDLRPANKQLSGGQRQRGAWSRLCEPKVF